MAHVQFQVHTLALDWNGLNSTWYQIFLDEYSEYKVDVL
jgi:hypothetical protein